MCSLRSVFRKGSCSICPLLLIFAAPLLLLACSARVAPRSGQPPSPRWGWTAETSMTPAPDWRPHVRIGGTFELYPKGCSAKLERLDEEMFQVPAVRDGDVGERGAVDHDQRRV